MLGAHRKAPPQRLPIEPSTTMKEGRYTPIPERSYRPHIQPSNEGSSMSTRYVMVALFGFVALTAAAPAGATITFNGRSHSTVTLSTNTSKTIFFPGGQVVFCTTGVEEFTTGTDSTTATISTPSYTTSRSAVRTSCSYIYQNMFFPSGVTVNCSPPWRFSPSTRTSGQVIIPNNACTADFDAGPLNGSRVTLTASTVAVTWRQDADGVGGILSADPNNRLYTTSSLFGSVIATTFEVLRDTTMTIS